MENSSSLCLDAQQKSQLKPKLARRVLDAARRGHKTVLQLLLDMGADINERNVFGETTLLGPGAVCYNHLPCVKMLIERGVDTTIPAHGGVSVLHRAAAKSTSSETMKILLDVAGAWNEGFLRLHSASLFQVQKRSEPCLVRKC